MSFANCTSIYILTDQIESVIISSTIVELQLSSFKMANFVRKFANWRNYNSPMNPIVGAHAVFL
jgi:hypothetical protein